jgi:phosphatidylinositol dimannoside acyltransferase
MTVAVEAPAPPAAPRDAAGDRRAYRIFRSAEWLGMHLPRTLGLPAAEIYHRVYFERARSERRTVADNLSRVLGHPPDSPLVERATEECFRLYGRYWYETFALRTMPAEEVLRRHTIDGMEQIERAIAGGTGIVCALPHMGNWDAAGHWLALKGYPMTAVAEELEVRRVFELFYRHRRALGMNIVPLSMGRRVAEVLVQLIAQNHVITLVADRDLTGKGVDVEMFGAIRQLPAGPALLSITTGAPLCVAAVFTTAHGWHTRINPPVEVERTGQLRTDVTAMMRVVAEQFERFIAAAPADWHMFQPAWPEADGSARAAPPGA